MGSSAMRICFVSTGKAWGGGERLLAWLIAGIADAGEEVALVARQGSSLANWGRDRSGMSLLQLPGRGRSPRSLWRLRRWLVANRFEVVVLNDPHAISSGGVAALGLNATRIGIRHTVFRIHSAWKHRRLLDQIICVSHAAERECVAAGIPAEQIAVIHGGVPHSEVDRGRVEQVRQMFHHADPTGDDQHLLALGSLQPVKGLDTLIRAVARSRQAGRSWRLWIAGDGPEREGLQSLAVEFGVADRVHLLGFRHDIGELLSAADVFANASHSEGLSLVLVEAMLARCPIASTTTGGSREVLNVNESDGSPFAATFTPGDVESSVAAIDEALSADAAREQRLDRALRWAQRNFSVEQMAQKHLALYRSLLAENSPAGLSTRRSAA